MNKVVETLKNSRNILIISHRNPDGDTIGANFGLYLSLKNLGKEITSYCDSEIPFEFKFLLSSEINFTNDIEQVLKKKFDTVVMIDCADNNRVKNFDKIRMSCKILINIDHHVTNNNFGDINLVQPEKSSTGEIVYNILKQGNFPLNKEIVVPLYVAVMTDTGSFRYSNTTSETFIVASELISYGINAYEITEKVYESKPYKRILLLKEALNNLYLSENKKVAVMTLNKDILKKYNASYDDTDGFVNYGRSIKGVEISIFIEEQDDGCKLSFRSKGNIDVAEIALKCGGGGHRNAAGAFVESNLNATIEKINCILKQSGY